MNEPIRISLGNEADYQVFSKKLRGSPKDYATICHYWRCSKKKQHLLVVRRVGPHQSQCVVMPLDTLPTLDKVIGQAKFQSPKTRGTLFLNIPKGRYFAFGAMVLEPDQDGQLHRSEFDINVEIPDISAGTAPVFDRDDTVYHKVTSVELIPAKPKKKAKKDAK